MVNEFQESDYEAARGSADAIKQNAENIMSIFNDIDRIMKELYGQAWQSAGANEANARYNIIRKNYEVFYNQIIEMHKHIHAVTTRNEEADQSASANVLKI